MFGSSVALVSMLTLSTTFTYMLNDMVVDLGASEDETSLMRQISNVGALLVVFLAGALGERLGGRRVMAATSIVFAAGSLLVMLAPNIGVATLGLLLANIGKSVMFVVGIAYVAAAIQDPQGRATAFSAVSASQPMAYLVMPVAAGFILLAASWRAVALTWVIGGICAFVGVRRLFPEDPQRERATGEMITPALAGLVLAMFVTLFGTVPTEGFSISFWISVGVALVALLTLVMLYRRMAKPTLSLAPLAHGGLILLFLVVILFGFANLYYYTINLFQIVYGYSPLGAAILMIPAQLAGIAGAVVVRKMLQRKGVTFSGTLLILAVAGALFLSLLVQPDSHIIVPILVVSLYGLVSLGAFIAMTNAIMNLAKPGQEGDTSAYKTAASNIGSAIGVTLMTAVVTTVGMTAMNVQLADSDMSEADVSDAGWALLYGTSPDEVSEQYGMPIEEVNELGEMESTAFVASYHGHGIVGGTVTALAGVVFLIVRRRMDAAEAAEAAHASSADTSDARDP